MDGIANLSAFMAAIALGLTAGALLAEGGLLVPFWQSMAPEAFLVWYKEYAGLLQGFFGPLELAAGALTVIAAGSHWGLPGFALLAIAALLTAGVLAVFPLYFQRANTSFARGTIATDKIAQELERWAIWHWGRTLLAISAFACALMAL